MLRLVRLKLSLVRRLVDAVLCLALAYYWFRLPIMIECRPKFQTSRTFKGFTSILLLA